MRERPKSHVSGKRRVERPAVGASGDSIRTQRTISMPIIPPGPDDPQPEPMEEVGGPTPKKTDSNIDILKGAAAGMSVILGGLVLIVLFLAAIALLGKGTYELFSFIF